MKSFSAKSRAANIERLSSEEFDLVIIGGGISGAGVARDASMRGMRVALVEAHDFASGTSSRSSKLIHGGIRYLENMEFKLVFEALSERQKLFEMAPHLAHPLRFMIPLYEGGRVGMFKMGLGMWAYDALSLFQAPELHERLDAHESLQRMPSLQGYGLLGSYVYSDAYMDDDRLVVETLRSAVDHGAVCANYVKATGAVYSKDKTVCGVECQDSVSRKKFQIRARHVVSTVGAWTDELGASFFEKWKKILRPTKGIHLTFEKKRLPLSSAVVMGAEQRIVFGIPRHEMVIVGTTDTDFQGNPEGVVAEAADVQYLLGVIHQYFPGAEITAADIVASYAGVRPLVYDGASTEGKTSREHSIFTVPEQVTMVAGGKYTTYRLISEQVIEECLKYFSVEDQVKWGRCETEKPLNPLVTQETQLQKEFYTDEILLLTHWSAQEASVFFDRHGGEALEIVKKFGVSYSAIELEALHAMESTMCLHLVDFYSRRVPLFLSQRDHGLGELQKIGRIFKQVLGWDLQTLEREKQELAQYMSRELSWVSALKSV